MFAWRLAHTLVNILTRVRDGQRPRVLQEADEHGGGRGGDHVHHDVGDEEADEEAY